MSLITPPPRMVNAAFGLALAALGAGCPLLEVEVEVSEVCMTRTGIEITGVPFDVAMGVDERFTFDDLSAFDAIKDLDADAHFTRATVRATHGVDTLTFVEAASVEIASNDPDSTLPTRMIYACDGDCPARDNALVIPVQDRSDALDYIRSGSLSIALQARGSMPTADWKMDVEVCIGARAAYAYEP